MNKIDIRSLTGKIVGYIETDDKGNQKIRTFEGKEIGYYDKLSNKTRWFDGKIGYIGNHLEMLLGEYLAKR